MRAVAEPGRGRFRAGGLPLIRDARCGAQYEIPALANAGACTLLRPADARQHTATAYACASQATLLRQAACSLASLCGGRLQRSTLVAFAPTEWPRSFGASCCFDRHALHVYPQCSVSLARRRININMYCASSRGCASSHVFVGGRCFDMRLQISRCSPSASRTIRDIGGRADRTRIF